MNSKMREVLISLKKETKKTPEFRVGDNVKVHVKIREGEKERVQVFEGTVIKRKRGGEGASFTVRKISYGVGVERVFAFQSPSIDRVEVMSRGKARRARLFYLRNRKGKEAFMEGTSEGIESSETPKEGVLATPPKPTNNLAAATHPVQ